MHKLRDQTHMSWLFLVIGGPQIIQAVLLGFYGRAPDLAKLPYASCSFEITSSSLTAAGSPNRRKHSGVHDYGYGPCGTAATVTIAETSPNYRKDHMNHGIGAIHYAL